MKWYVKAIAALSGGLLTRLMERFQGTTGALAFLGALVGMEMAERIWKDGQ